VGEKNGVEWRGAKGVHLFPKVSWKWCFGVRVHERNWKGIANLYREVTVFVIGAMSPWLRCVCKCAHAVLYCLFIFIFLSYDIDGGDTDYMYLSYKSSPDVQMFTAPCLLDQH
jgi:hypothetical protein